MIRNLALGETALSVRNMVSRRLMDGLAPQSSAFADCAPAWRALAELGALNAVLPEAQGGLGGGLSDGALILEPLGRFGAAVPFLDGICGPAALATRLPAHAGLTRLLEEAAAGGKPLALAWIEPGRGWARRPAGTTAIREGERWRLTGVKSTVRWAPEALGLIVSAACEDGTGLFLVRTGTSGLSLTQCPTADGHAAADLHISDLILDADSRLDTGDADRALDFVLDAMAALSLAEAVGAMDACLDKTVDYLKTRQQFGAPLSRQQALQHRLAEIYADCETAWSMAIDAATALDSAVPARERQLRVSAAKAYVGEVSRRAALAALQLHGAMGMTMDYPLGRLVARITLIDLSNGDSRWHLDRLSRLLGEYV